MSRSFLHPLIVAALLSLSFSSLAQAAEYRLRERTLRFDLLRAAIEFLVGCGLDPHAICVASPPKHGCSLDPHGACLPSGASTSTTGTVHGCGLDPNGACIGG